ncbi:MAG TPA: CapA family protein [Thermomicrobiales bacterium]|nr:CapA family protein [Thermomicrobiales bacterium]
MSRSNAGSISLVGDLMLRQRLRTLRRDHDAGLDGAIAAMRESEVVTANLEMPLSRRGSKMLKNSSLRSDPEIIEDVREMGIHAVSLANNHMMDYGSEALADTLSACDDAGILRCGAGLNLAEALAPCWLEAGGKRVALLSVSSTLPLGSEAYESMPGIAPIRVQFSLEVDTNLINEQPGTMPVVHSWARAEDQELVCGQVRELAAQAELVIVAIHWGVPSWWLSPYQGLLATYQQPLGHALIDAGAGVVFGHHSHSLHGIEAYNGAPIFYSAGNFIFERPRGFMEPESLIARITIGAGNALGVEIVPLWVDERGLPELATGEVAGRVLDKLAALSAPFNTRLEVEDDTAWLVLS